MKLINVVLLAIHQFSYYANAFKVAHMSFSWRPMQFNADSGASTSGSQASTGVCDDLTESVGSLTGTKAQSMGIFSISACATYAWGSNQNAYYVSFSPSGGDCAWFSSCSCIDTSSCNGTEWQSSSIANYINPPKSPVSVSGQTVPLPTANVTVSATGQVTMSASASSGAAAGSSALNDDTSTAARNQCDDSIFDLIRTLNTQCSIQASVTLKRVVAGMALLIVFLVTLACLKLAHYFDGREKVKRALIKSLNLPKRAAM